MRMSEMAWRLAWFAVVAAAVSYASYLLVGSVVNARAAGTADPILVRDVLSPGVHSLTGMVMVPTPCDQLSVRTEEISKVGYRLVFRTWREPSIKSCAPQETPRPFRAVLFAPAAGIYFTATLDEDPLPLTVIPQLPPR